jgi:elongator complex protein 1
MPTFYSDAGLTAKTDEALKFLLYMVDVNVLYDVALGTYDFDLVMMVAEKSQKDPKEYLPFLNRLQALELTYCKFSIDLHLQRWPSALGHIAQLPDHFPECLQLVEEQRLYKPALALLPAGSDRHQAVCRSYAVYLRSKRYLEEASYLWERAGCPSEAADDAAEALAWERAGRLAAAAGWSTERRAELHRKLAEGLEAAGRGEEAAVVQGRWLADPEEAVAVLARCHRWQQALRQAGEDGRPDLVQTHVVPALRARTSELEAEVAARTGRLEQMAARLAAVRKGRAAGPASGAPGEEEDDRNLEDAELFSETSSVGSGGASTVRTARSSLATRASGRSGKSSKTRRKADRRLYSVKEGSSHEDLGLVAALHELVSGLPGLREEVGRLLRGLAEAGGEGGELQAATAALLERAGRLLPEVWPEEEGPEGERWGPGATTEDIVRGAAGAGAAYRTPLHLLPPHLRAQPLLKYILPPLPTPEYIPEGGSIFFLTHPLSSQAGQPMEAAAPVASTCCFSSSYLQKYIYYFAAC